MIPEIDSQIGIRVYSTDFPGTGGTIRNTPSDFDVSEVISKRAIMSLSSKGDYCVYKLKKRRIDTTHALDDVFRRTRIRLKSLGLKDALASTTQYVCAKRKDKPIDDLKTDKYELVYIGSTERPLSKREMVGNRFTIKIQDCSDTLKSFCEYDEILNFYGYQRFGSKRPVTHLIGKALVQQDFDHAVRLVLAFTSPYDSAENTEIRDKLQDPNNYAKYLDQVPSKMDIERIILKEMINHSNAYRALRALPISLRRFFVQSFQAFLFNVSLSDAYSAGEDLFEPKQGDICFDSKGVINKMFYHDSQKLAMPFVGYAYYKKTRFNSYILNTLKEQGVSPKSFFVTKMQEISSEGGFRQTRISCTNSHVQDDTVRFTLSRGSFATIVLREIIKPTDPILAGF